MIELKNIDIKYTDNLVISNLNLNLNEKETTVIVGPSGSGKSTLLRTLNLLNQPTSGELIFDKFDLKFPNRYQKSFLNSYRQNFGMVFQNFNLFPHLTVEQNVQEGPIYVQKRDKDEVKQESRDLLAMVGLLERKEAYPSELSGGQQQRVAIARALAMHPRFILFDEPTSALDPELEGEVLNVIANLANQNNSQIIVTHNLNFAREIADRMIFFENGKIGFDGDVESFFNSDNPRINSFTKKILK